MENSAIVKSFLIGFLIFVLFVGSVFGVYFLQEAKMSRALGSYKSRIEGLQSEVITLTNKIKLLEEEKLKLELSHKTYSKEDYVGWKDYSNAKLGYRLKYPRDTQIVGSTLNDYVEFVGPLDGEDRWPKLSVIHYDSPFYHPPAGTDVRAWVLDKIPHDEEGLSTSIGGVSAIHLVTKRSAQTYASDDYYFIKGNQLFHIQLLHSSDKQDWALYYKFLRSFKFGDFAEKESAK